MENLNYSKLDKIINDYKEHFEDHRQEEIYKWKAIKTFQDNWNIDAEDFTEMLKQSLKDSANLLNSAMYFPKLMIIQFSEREKEKTREMFKILFDENIEFTQRYERFVAMANGILTKYWEKGKNHYQDAHAISTYLTFRYPDKYYMYKSSIDNKIARFLDINIYNRDKAEELKSYFILAERVLNYIKNDDELLKLSMSSLTGEYYKDKEFHILAWDLLFYGGRKILEESKGIKTSYKRKGMKVLKKFKTINGEYFCDIDITTDEWRNLLKDPEIFTEDRLDAIKKWYYQKEHKASCKEISEMYGKTPNYYNNLIWQLGKKVSNHLNRFLIVDEDSNPTYWIVVMNGRYKSNLFEWQLREELVKALEDEKLVEFIGENNIIEKQYFWLNANPKIWSYSELDIDGIIEYTSENERGNKRKIYRNFLDAKKGDLVIAYESTPTKAIVGLCEVEEGLNNGIIKIKKTENLINLVPYNEIINLEEMKNAEVTKNNQGSFFKLTKTEFDSIIDLIREYNPKNQTTKAKYSKEEFLKEVYISENQYNKIVNLIKRKKNIILQGAPGVGKTFMAKRLAYSIMGEKDNDRIKCIQFHQSYSYEDFIEGWRPTETSYEIEKGIFYNFCKMAENDKNKDYFFIIDEINRGNLSKIFGELLMLVENDKREEKLNLAYSKMPFSVPSNVYIIGMMNTADRSLAIIDYALRRRFAFCHINPAFDSEQFKNYQTKLNSSKFNELLEIIKQLNIEIEQDPTLGSGFKIGHSYFCNLENVTIENIASIIEYEILPLIEEYWFDDTDKYNVWLNKLNGVING